MSNRVSLKDRRKTDTPNGVDAIITPSGPELPGTVGATSPPSEALAKATVYIRPDQVIAIEEIQVRERRRTGRKKDKSELAQEAFDLLIQQYAQTE